MNTNQKICTKCKQAKDFSEFHKDKKTKDGLFQHCKKCEKSYRQANKEKMAEYHKAYRKLNKDKIAEYRQTHKEYHVEYSKKYYQSHKDKIAELKKAYYQTHKEKKAEQGKAYRQTPMGKIVCKNSKHKYRAITKQGDVTTEQLLDLQQNAKVCYWCGCKLKGKKIHIDHYVPISKGGQHTLSNLVITCNKCNLSKNAKDPEVFANSIGKLL